MKITKQGVLIIILTIGLVLAFSKYGRADSIICDDLIFTETSDIGATPSSVETIFRGTIPVKDFTNVGAGGARIQLHTGSTIYFDQMSQCMSIEDEVNSVKNLKWFLERSMDARISNWKHQR